MTNSDVHAATHPSGHPNKTAVNAENPIFGRPDDVIPEVSIEQAGIVQSEKNPRETVISPLINEAIASPAEEAHPHPATHAEHDGTHADCDECQTKQAQDSTVSAEDLDAVAAETAAKEATAGEPTASELTPAEQEDAAGKEGVEPLDDDEEESPQDSEPAEAPADPAPAA